MNYSFLNSMKKHILLTFIMFVSVSLLIGCQDNELPDKDYKDFTHIDHWDETNNFTNEETIVFYYSPYCEICQSIQDEATQYLVILENRNMPIYMVHEGMIYEQGTPPLDMIETPSILVYKNGVFDEIISGSKPILNYLSEKTDD